MKFIKSFFKYYLPMLIFFGALGTLFLVYMVKNHTPILKFVFGGARIHSNLANAIVKEDGIELPNATVFILENGNKLLVYTPESKSYDVIVIDKLNNDLGITNSGKQNYELVFDKFLFQTENAYGVAPRGKMEFKPNLKINDEQITYLTHRLENKKIVDVNHEIIFKGK